jgi:hypothetical protein
MPVSTSTDQRPLAPQPGDGEVIGERRARQGFKDRPILWVLLISLVLVVVAFAVAFKTNDNPQAAAEGGFAQTTEPAAAQAFDAPEPAAKVVPSN